MSMHKNPRPLTPHGNVNVQVHDKVLPGMMGKSPLMGDTPKLWGPSPLLLGMFAP